VARPRSPTPWFVSALARKPTRGKNQSDSISTPGTILTSPFSTSQHQTSTGFTSGHEADGGIRHGLFTTIALMRSFAE
jgi:hypothetical protein